jgi:integrase
MPLTARDIASAIQAAKTAGKPIKKFDERGLFLFAKPNGSALWRLKFILRDKEKLISLGRFPDVSLKMARDKAVDARRTIDGGVNPAEERRAERVAYGDTFKIQAEEWLKRRTDLEPNTIRRHQSRLETFVYPHIGNDPIGQIKALQLLAVLRKVEAQGKLDTAKRIRELCSSIWTHAVLEGKAQFDAAASLKGAIKTAPQKSHAAITDPKKLGGLLRAIDGYSEAEKTSPLTQAALKLAAFLFVRPGELRRMEWKELNLEDAIWRIPAEKMKMRDPHIVPLSKQAVEIIDGLKVYSGTGRYVFPSLQTADRPMSENTVNAGLRRLGYTREEHVGHGFRATASTLLNEQGYAPDVIELQLAHKARGVRAIYNRALRLEERRKMMQDWSDYLDQLRAAK